MFYGEESDDAGVVYTVFAAIYTGLAMLSGIAFVAAALYIVLA